MCDDDVYNGLCKKKLQIINNLLATKLAQFGVLN